MDASVIVSAFSQAEQLLVEDPYGALVLLDNGHLLVSQEYWRSPEQADNFEAVAGLAARKQFARRAVFVTTIITDGRHTDCRPPLPEPQAGETRELFALSVDMDHGLDVLRADLSDHGCGDIEKYEGALRLQDGCPGAGFVKVLTS